MKKIICLLFAIILTVCAVGCGETQDNNEAFYLKPPEDLVFGMEKDEIIDIYGEPDKAGTSWLYYNITDVPQELAENVNTAHIELMVEERGLETAGYTFIFQTEDKNLTYLSILEKFKNNISEKYDKYPEEMKEFFGSENKNKYSNLNEAISAGDLSLMYTWKLEQFTIKMLVQRGSLYIGYYAK